MPGPITGILQRSSKATRLHSGFVFVVLLLLGIRLLPFFWIYENPGQTLLAPTIEEGAAIVSGRISIPASQTTPHLKSYLTAAVMFVDKTVNFSELKEAELEIELVKKTRRYRFILGLISSIFWVALSLQVYYIVKIRTDYWPALFALFFMAVTPSSLCDVGQGGFNLILAFIVYNALLQAMKVRSRGQRTEYLLGAFLSALATAFSYHYLILFVPFLYCHLRSQNRCDNFLTDVGWHLRGLSATAFFIITGLLCHPQLWKSFTKLLVSNPLLQIAKIPSEISLKNLLINNDLAGQFTALSSAQYPWSILWSFGYIMGYSAFLAAFFLGLRGLFKRDQRAWRPMAIFFYLTVVMRFFSPVSGIGSLVVLAPVLASLLSVGILGLVMQNAFDRESRVFTIAGIILSIECLIMIGLPIAQNHRTTTELQAAQKILELKVPFKNCLSIGPAIHIPGVKKRRPKLVPIANTMEDVIAHWSINLVKLNNLKKRGITYIFYKPEFMIKLKDKSVPSDASQIDRLSKKLHAQKKLATFEASKNTGVMGPKIILVQI